MNENKMIEPVTMEGMVAVKVKHDGKYRFYWMDEYSFVMKDLEPELNFSDDIKFWDSNKQNFCVANPNGLILGKEIKQATEDEIEVWD